MKLIEEIKKVEEKAEKLKKNAHEKGQRLVEEERESSKKALAAMDHEKETLIEKNLNKAKSEAEKKIDSMDKIHKKELEELASHAGKYVKKAVSSTQDIIIAWPSSH